MFLSSRTRWIQLLMLGILWFASELRQSALADSSSKVCRSLSKNNSNIKWKVLPFKFTSKVPKSETPKSLDVNLMTTWSGDPPSPE
jgi:hypothetical protein